MFFVSHTFDEAVGKTKNETKRWYKRLASKKRKYPYISVLKMVVSV